MYKSSCFRPAFSTMNVSLFEDSLSAAPMACSRVFGSTSSLTSVNSFGREASFLSAKRTSGLALGGGKGEAFARGGDVERVGDAPRMAILPPGCGDVLADEELLLLAELVFDELLRAGKGFNLSGYLNGMSSGDKILRFGRRILRRYHWRKHSREHHFDARSIKMPEISKAVLLSYKRNGLLQILQRFVFSASSSFVRCLS